MKKITILLFAVFILSILTSCDDGNPPNEVHSPADAAGRVIGALAGSPSARLADEMGYASLFSEVDEMMNSLRSGAVDCVIMERLGAREAVDSTRGVRMLSEPLLEYDLRFAIARENNQLPEEIDKALAALSDNGTLNGLRGRYFSGRNYSYSSPPGIQTGTRDLVLAVSQASAPFSYINTDGEFAGLNVDVARAVCDYLGLELIIVSVEVANLIPEVMNGRVDIALGWLPDDLGDNLVNVSEPYADIAQVVIVRR